MQRLAQAAAGAATPVGFPDGNPLEQDTNLTHVTWPTSPRSREEGWVPAW
jgi:hypothetical protein